MQTTTVESLLTNSQRKMMQDLWIEHPGRKPTFHRGMNMALCFQPLQETYNFEKGIAMNEEGKYMFDKDGKGIMERNLIIAHKAQLGKLAKPQTIYHSPRN